jgi:transcriptional regulator with XRE-family HTH domain
MIAKLSGISFSQISKIKNNIHKPKPETIEKLIKVYFRFVGRKGKR